MPELTTLLAALKTVLRPLLRWILPKLGDKWVEWYEKKTGVTAGQFVVSADRYYRGEMELHRHPYVPREERGPAGKTETKEVVKQIQNWILGPSQFLILSGTASVGKTRACIETSKLNALKWIFLKAYQSSPEKLTAGLDEAIGEKTVCVYEDCQEYSNDVLRAVIDAIFRKGAKLLIVTTDEEGPKLAIGPRAEPNLIQLRKLADPGIGEIVRARSDGKLSQQDVKNIVYCCEGLPGIAILAVDLYTNGEHVQPLRNAEELLETIYERCKKKLTGSWSEIEPRIGKLALLRGDKLSKDEYSKARVAMSNLLVKEENENCRIQPSILSDYIARKVYFDPIGEAFAHIVDECLQKKAREILTTVASCRNKDAAKVLLKKADVLDSKTILDLGIMAYISFQELEFVQSRLGEFWNAVWNTNNTEDYDRTAALLARLGKWDDAEKCWIRAVELYTQRNQPLKAGMVYNHIAWMYLQKNDWQRALDLYRQAIAVFERIEDSEGLSYLARTYSYIGSLYTDKGDWQNASNELNRAIDTLNKLTGDHARYARAQAQLLLGTIFEGLSDLKEAIRFYELARTVFSNLNATAETVTACTKLSLANLKNGDWQTANNYYQDARRMMSLLGDYHLEAGTYLAFGKLYLTQGNWQEAEKFYRSAFETSKQIADASGTAYAELGLASVHQGKGDLNRAIELFQHARQSFEELQNGGGAAHAELGLGSVYLAKAELDNAIQFYERAFKAFHQSGNRHSEAYARLDLGVIYQRRGDKPQAELLYNDALVILEEIGDQAGMAYANLNIGAICHDTQDWENAIAFYEIGRGIAAKIGNVPLSWKAVEAMGAVYEVKGETERARGIYQDSLNAYRKLKDPFALATVLLRLGWLSSQKGYWDEAASYFSEAFETAEKLGNLQQTSEAIQGHASVLEKKGDWSGAVQRYERALDDANRIGDRLGMGNIYVGLAGLCERTGEWDKGAGYCDQAIAIFKVLDSTAGLVSAYSALALIYLGRGSLREAITLCEEALAICLKTGYEAQLTALYNILGWGHSENRMYSEALAAYDKSLKIAVRIEDRQTESYVYNNLAMVYSAQGEFDKALQLYQSSEKIKTALADVYGLAWVHDGVGVVRMKTGKCAEAEELLTKALQTFSDLHAEPDVKRVRQHIEELIHVCYKEGNLTEAARLETLIGSKRKKAGQP